MDAERLIFAGRHALAQSRTVPDIVAEAWQAQALAQAIGGRLAVYGPPELRGEARGLSETGGRGVGALEHPGVHSGGIRAAQLSGMADARATLLGLGALLGDVGIALVQVACGTDDEGLYWSCVEAIDAADESSDRVRTMLRKLAAREAGRPPDARRARAGPIAVRPDRPLPSPADSSGSPGRSGAVGARGLPGAQGSQGSQGSCEAPGAVGELPGETGVKEKPDAVDSAAGRL
ncbi:DUF6099 family protein [Streptomyces katsurahamanus]|uniref:DUF6099 family protein n=1 Tax=Streptomyces katsurahamanus TaxID=2577098 RepID=UPI00389AEEC5